MLFLALAMGLCLALPTAALADTTATEITQLRTERGDDGVLLSANVRFELPAAVDDALAKGIPMFFVAEAVVSQNRWYWTDRRVAEEQRHMRLSYQPLTRRWRLLVSPTPITNPGTVLGQNFDTRDEALAVVQRITRWKIAENAEIEHDVRYNLEFRFRLDRSQLPRPFQIGAVGQAEWNIGAERSQRLVMEPSSR